MDNPHQQSAQKQVHSSRGHSGQNINVANYSSYALEVHPVHIIVGEINNVLAAMRLNSRWSSRARILNSNVHEGPLLKGFRTLRNYLDHHPIYDISRVDGLIYLKPFLSVIRSEETSGPITGIALDSINKFLKSFLKLHTPNVAKAIESIAEAVIHCRFEATDPDSDEVVLIKILQVLLSCIHSSVGVLLRDDIILEMTQTCFRMSTQSRLSALLRKTAEQTLIDMILTTFQRRHDYDNYQNIMYHLQNPQEEHHPLPDTPRTRHTNPQGVLFHSHERAPDQPVQDNNNYGHSHAQVTNVHNVSLQNIKPFSNSCIVKIFLFVCNLISGKVTPNTSIAQTTLNTVVHLGWDLPALLSDPNHEHYHHSQPESTFANKTSSQEGVEQPTQTAQEQPPPPPADNLTSSEQAEEDICLLGLTILNGILERSIQSLAKNKSILKIIQNILTKNLLKNINSDNLGIVSISLRVYFILFIHLKEHLKGPLELFINSLIKIIDLKIAYYEKQEVILESILEFCKDPYFVQDLFVNYDCDQHCSNLFESLSKFLYKNAFPVGGSIYSSHLVALDSLLAIVQNITNRVLVSHSSENDEFETIAADNLRNLKKMKTTLFSGVELFNPDPEPGLKYLRESQILPTPPDSTSVARFLRHTYGLNKTTLGEYIGKGKEFNISVLNSYVSQFNFSKDEKFIYSLRNFMESFRIPGEAPVIARILETFAQHYYDAVKEPFANVDAVYVLCYSVVLLNVDQHNPEVKNRMTEEQFIRNNRGINGGKDLPVEMLKEIYYNIKNSEMKILEEHLAAGGSVNDITDGMWRQLLTKPYAPFIAVKSHSYDKDVFQVLWGHLIAAISVVFDTANDDHILEKCMHGYNLCAQISAHYGTYEVTDSLITSLSKFSGLLGLPQNVNYAYNYGYTSTNPTVGALANFVHNKKAQSSTKFVFSTVLSYPNLLRESWKSVIGCILTLHKLKILPDFLDKFELQDEDSTNGNSANGPNQSNRSTVQASGMGFLSILSASGWFGGASYSAPESSASQDPSYGYESDLQAELQRRAQELIAQYNIPTIILGSKAIITDNESLLGLLRAVMQATMRTRTATSSSTGTTASSTPAIPQVNHPFDEKAALFAVDVLFNLLFINIERFHEIWKPLAEHFGNLLEAATTSNDSPRGTATSMALVDRIVTGLFAFIMKLRSTPDLKLSEDEIFQCLHVLAKLGGPPRPSSPNTRETQPQPSALEFQAKKIINALIRLYDGSFIIRSNEVLKTLNYVLDVTCHVPSAELQALHFVKSLVLKSDSVDGVPHYTNLNTSNFNIWIECAALFMTPKNSSSICIQTMEILLNMFSVVPVLLHIPLNDTPSPHQEEVLVTQAWSVYWLPILQKFCGLCHDPRLDVRNAGMTFLQRALLSPQLSLLPPTGWLLCFQDVMFPLMETLLKGPAEVLPPPPSSRHKLDSAGLEETRLRAAALLSKIFLQYLPKLTTLPNFSQLWLDILRFMEMYMVSDSELLAEAVRESLKNVLLVMSASGLFQTGFSSTLTSPSEDIWKLSSSDL